MKLLILKNFMSFFTYKLLQKYKFKSKSIYIIFDHTTIDNRFVILQISLKIGKSLANVLGSHDT